MKVAAIALLVLLLIVAPLPVAAGMGMAGMGDCPACTPGGSLSLGLCFALLTGAIVLSFSVATQRLRIADGTIPMLLLFRAIDKPPQKA